MALLVMLIAALALVAAGCGGDDDEAGSGDTAPAADGGDTGDVEALPASSCAPLEYEGEGTPTALIVSDLPRQGGSRLQTDQMTEAIRFILEQNNWQAGDVSLAYQDCDDATAQAAKWDPGKCSQNGNAYAENEKVIGIIGTFNSGCAQVIIPIANQAPGGAIPMISPANTLVNLTASGPGIPEDEPDKYYPTGTRNYARVAPPDKFQGAAVAEFAVDQGIESVYILNDRESYGLGVATNFRNAAEHLGIEVSGFEAYDPTSSSFEALFRGIGQTNPDAVFVGGLIDENAGQLIEDKVKVLGPNSRRRQAAASRRLHDGRDLRPGRGWNARRQGRVLQRRRCADRRLPGCWAGVRLGVPGGEARWGSGRPVLDLCRPGGPDLHRFDRRGRRRPGGDHRGDLRHGDHGRADRLVRDRRQR